MTKQEARWTFEYVILPEAMFGDNASEIVQGILYTHEQYFINVFNLLNAADTTLTVTCIDN